MVKGADVVPNVSDSPWGVFVVANEQFVSIFIYLQRSSQFTPT